MILISIPILTSKKPVTTTGAGAMGNYYFKQDEVCILGSDGMLKSDPEVI